MKKILSWLLVITMVCSFVPMTFAAWNDAPELSLTATNDNGTVTVTLATTEATELSALNFNLNYPTDKVTLKSTQKNLEKNTGFYTASDGEGGQMEDKATISLRAGTVGYAIAVSSNTAFAANSMLFAVDFTINDGAAGKIDFTLSNLSAGQKPAGSYNYTSAETPAAFVSVPMTSVTLSGSVTTPVKGAADASSVTAGEGCTANVTWSPALSDGKFAAKTAYTATVTLTPATGYVFADGMTVSGLSGFTFTKSGSSYVASKTFAATEDKSLTALAVTTQPAKTSYTHGDAFDATGMVVKASYDDASTNAAFTDYTVGYESGSYLKKGDTKVTLSAGGKTVDVPLTVAAKQLTIADLTAVDRVYSKGYLYVDLTPGYLNGVVEGEDVTAVIPLLGKVADDNVGSGKAVTVETPELSGKDGANYTLAPITGLTVNITRADSTLVLNASENIVFGADAPKPTASVNTSGANITYTYSATEKGTYGAWDKANVPGTYYVKGHTEATDNYNAADSAPVSFTVAAAKMPDNVTASVSGTAKYGQTLSASTENFPLDGVKAYQWYRGENAIADATAAAYKLAAADVGQTITVKVSDSSGNYSGAATSAATAAVAKADAPTLSAAAVQTLLSKSVVSGSKSYEFTLSDIVSGIPADSAGVGFAVKTSGTYTGSCSVNSGKLTFTVTDAQTAGTEDSVTLTFSSANYENADVTVSFAFKNKIDVSSKLTLENISVVYGESYTVAATYDGKASDNITYTYSSASRPTAAGTYTVTANYSDDVEEAGIPGHIGTTTATLTIAPKPVTLAWGEASLTYDGTEQTVTAQVTNKVGSDTFDLTYDGNTAADAGTYTAAVTALGNDNYTLTGASNVTKEWTISAKTLTAAMVTLGKDPNYDTTEQAVEVTVTDGEKTLVLDTDYTVTGNTATDVGSYTVAVTGQGNYTGKVEKSWQMLKTEQPTAVVLTGASEKTFGDEPFDVTVSGGSGTGAYSVVSSNTNVLTVEKKNDNTFTVTIVNAGEADLTATRAGDDNYAYRNSEPLTVTVAKAERTVSVENASVTLLPNALSATVEPSVSAGEDDVTYTYSSSKTSVVTVNASGVMTAVADGTATITVTASGRNFNNATATVEVTAYKSEMISGVEAGEGRTAEIVGSRIVVSGTKAEEEPVVVTLTLAPGFVQDKGEKDNEIVVKYDEAVVATYTVDTSNVVVVPANVEIKAAETTVDEEIKLDVSDYAGDENAAAAADEVLTYAVQEDTKAVGLDVAAAKTLADAAAAVTVTEEQKALLGDDYKIEVTVDVAVTPTAISYSDGALQSITVDITPSFALTATGNGNTVPLGNETIEQLPVKVLIQVCVPVGFEVNYAKHTHGDVTEYLPVTTDESNESNGYWVASWWQDSFSAVELVSDSRSVEITFTFADGSVQTVTYTPADIGTALPTASKSGYTFDGWTIKGTEYKTLDEALLGETTLSATAKFTENRRPSGGGAGVATFAVTIAKSENGTVSADVTKAQEGDTVTLTVKSDTGYTLGKLTVTDKDGKAVETKKVSDTTYTFTMPAGKVSVSAGFVKGGAMRFLDVKASDWFYDAVSYAVNNGLMNGTGNDMFSPNAATTRGMIFTMLARNAGVDTTGSGNLWYTAGMNWAKEQGISDGTRPEGNVTREELATMLYRYALLKGVDTKKYTENTNTLSYTDVFTISDWASEGMHFCIAAGVIGGDTNGMLNPTNNATRAEVATMLMRFLEQVK